MAVDTVKKVKEVLGSNDYGANAAQPTSEPGIINKIMGFEGLAGKNAKIPTVTEIMGFNGVGQPTDAQKYPQKTTAVPTTPPVNQPPAKAPAIAGPIAATTAAPKQQPVAPAPSAQQTVPAIAGVNSFSFNSKQPAGGLVSNNSVSDFSPGSSNAQAIAGMSGLNVGPAPLTRTYDTAPGQQQTEQLGTLSNRGIAGLTYNEQVDRAKQVNEAGQRDLMQMSPRERAAAEVAGNANFGSFTRGGAKGDLADYEARRTAIAGQLADNQGRTIAGMKEQGDKYTADQSLAGVKYTGDAHIKAADIAGESAVQRAKVGAIEKQQEAKNKSADQKQKDTTALQQKVYDQITKGYDFTGISPTAVHDYATTMAKTAGKGYVTLADPTGTHGDVIVHPGVAAFANQHLKSVKTPEQYVRLLQELDKVAAGGIHRTGIKSTQQLKPLKVSPNQIAGMTTEQG